MFSYIYGEISGRTCRGFNLAYLFRLVPGAQTPGAQLNPFFPAVYSNGYLVNVGQPAPVGAVFGVTHVVSELG